MVMAGNAEELFTPNFGPKLPENGQKTRENFLIFECS